MTLDDVSQFHTALLNVAGAGIPVELEFPSNGTAVKVQAIDLRTSLDQIFAGLSDEVHSGRTLDLVVSEDKRLPASYRSALETWFACDQAPVALEMLTSTATSQQQARKQMEMALVQPLILLILGWLALIYVSSSTIPKIESIYLQLNKEPGWGLLMMTWIHSTIGFWSVLGVILIAAWTVYRRNRTSPIPPMLKGKRDHCNDYLQGAMACDQIAELLRYNKSFPESIRIVDSSHSVLDATNTGSKSNSLLQWAFSLQASEAGLSAEQALQSKSRQMRMVSNTLRYLNRIRMQRWRSWLPAIAMGIVGGVVVLIVGLSVFIPFVQLLRDLSIPGAN